ncbi:hypothetical protein LINPERPRIM_LOCUS7656 [Linum perenne]
MPSFSPSCPKAIQSPSSTSLISSSAAKSPSPFSLLLPTTISCPPHSLPPLQLPFSNCLSFTTSPESPPSSRAQTSSLPCPSSLNSPFPLKASVPNSIPPWKISVPALLSWSPTASSGGPRTPPRNSESHDLLRHVQPLTFYGGGGGVGGGGGLLFVGVELADVDRGKVVEE